MKRGDSDELAKVHQWANGHEVSSRGRTSPAIRDAYRAEPFPESVEEGPRSVSWAAPRSLAVVALLCVGLASSRPSASNPTAS